jgi:AcrR family transcriptional regulator
MSRNAEKLDERVRRTRDALGDAMMALFQEKPWASITVQDVLERSGVGRSTFYVHYTGKDDLFWSDAEEFLQAMSGWLERTGEASERVAPVREFFAHVAESAKLYDAIVRSEHAHDFLELAEGWFARGIAARLSALPRSKHLPEEARATLSRALAGAMLSLCRAWIAERGRMPAAEADALFHRLVWSGLPAAERTG